MAAATDVKSIVLAYSGGLDTSVILPWLKDHYKGCRTIAFVADIGQGDDELRGIEKKAAGSGADKCIVRDLKRTFVEQYLWPMLKSGAIYETKYLLGTSIARPLIAAEQVKVAHEEKADAVAHGATGKGNDQVRFELTYMALDPALKIIAPWKDPRFELTSREAAVEYAKARNIPVEAGKGKIYSRDRNLWHISHEGGELEDPKNSPEDRVFVLSVPVTKAPDTPEAVELEFDKGVPVSLNGRRMDGAALLAELNKLGGRHAIGQVDLVENRLVGMKSRGVYETPGGTILYAAHSVLESLTLDRDTLHYKQQVALRYAELVYYGQWFAPLREALDAFVDSTQRAVTGKVKLRLYKGNVITAGVESPNSLYSLDLASFVMGGSYNAGDAVGFIRLFGLPMKVQASLNARKQGKDEG
jgi:argininosuccinate synthase